MYDESPSIDGRWEGSRREGKEEFSRIVYARGAIANEVGPTRWRGEEIVGFGADLILTLLISLRFA